MEKLIDNVNENSLNKRFTNNNQYKEKANSNISLPNFVEKKVKNLRRSINSEKLKENINDIQINTIKENELIKCRIALISHWKILYGTTPNDHVIEASMDWFGRDIWPNLEGTENLPFTWSAANKLMFEYPRVTFHHYNHQVFLLKLLELFFHHYLVFYIFYSF